MQFVDVTAEWGIHFVQQNGMSSEKMLPETTGSGAAFFDYDGDNDLDLYLVNSGHVTKGRGGALNRLYRNDGARYVDVTAAANVPGRAYGMGVAAADYDNDGDTDIYLTNWGEDVLYRNDGGYFSDVTAEAGLGNPLWGSSAAFVDYDNDGDLDLCVANYVEFDIATHPWCGFRDMDLRFYCDPLEYSPTRDLLYRNNGDGSFAEVGEPAGIVREGNGLGLVAADLHEDGDQDLYIANDKTPNFFYKNQGDGTFEEIGLTSGTALSANGAAQAGMGVDAGDLDNDGDLDLFVTNYQLENNALYRNDGLFFTEVSFQAGLGEASLNYLGFGTGFFDYDNDGWLDLFVANGHVHDNIEDYDELATYAQQAQVFQNEGGGRFRGKHQGSGTGVEGQLRGQGDGLRRLRWGWRFGYRAGEFGRTHRGAPQRRRQRQQLAAGRTGGKGEQSGRHRGQDLPAGRRFATLSPSQIGIGIPVYQPESAIFWTGNQRQGGAAGGALALWQGAGAG